MEASSPSATVTPEKKDPVDPPAIKPSKNPDTPPVAASTEEPIDIPAEQTNRSSVQSKSSGSRSGKGSRVPGSSQSGGGTKPASTQTENRPKTATEALELAQAFRQKSATSANNGDYGKAFDLSSQAWETLRPFPGDPACKAVMSQLTAELVSLAGRANALVAPDITNTKRLVDQ